MAASRSGGSLCPRRGFYPERGRSRSGGEKDVCLDGREGACCVAEEVPLLPGGAPFGLSSITVITSLLRASPLPRNIN